MKKFFIAFPAKKFCRIYSLSSTNANKAAEAASNAAATASNAVAELTTEFGEYRAKSDARHDESEARHERSEARLGNLEDELKRVRSGKKSSESESESGYGHGDLVPPSTDKKPSADPRPSPRKLFAATGGTGNGAVLKATCTSTPVASAPSVFPSISFADTSPAPLEDLQEWAARRRIASGSQVSATAVTNLIKPYVSDQSINRILRRGIATKHERDYVQSISIALNAIMPFPFAEHFVYRGMDAKTPEDVFIFKDLMEKGELFNELGMLSTSGLYPLPNAFQNTNTHFAIRPKSGRLIQAFSKRKEEWEVLFAAGTSFRVLSFEDTEPDGSHSAPGRYKIVMEEVTSPIE